jgi:autophagy-related protein 11
MRCWKHFGFSPNSNLQWTVGPNHPHSSRVLTHSTETTISTPPARPSQLATAYLRTAHVHLSSAKQHLSSLRHQHSALRLAASALDLRVLQLTDAADELSASAQREMSRQAALLAGLDSDLELVGRIRIHPDFMSKAVRKALEEGAKARTIGDYVSDVKMRQVADTCAKTYGVSRP